MGFASDFCYRPVSSMQSMQPLYGVAGSCICYNAKDGSARRQSTTRSRKKGVETEAPLRRRLSKKPSHESHCPGSTRFCAHAAQRFPLAAHQQGSSRHRSRSGGCLESNVHRHPSGPPSCAPCRKPRGLRATGSFVYGHFEPALQPAAACSVLALALALARAKRIEGGRSRIHSSV
ncbi:uncharacterized protein TrAtP1_005662 [Trichoderma atroviride]|uniref:uncharacterized protein n=1 Tax=Hypocrea atroviridis TaxID=63577 RepID=UPI003333FDB1|nr:hypothetical protein TrAtP1_005662 [Trichoderma atroviride]